MAITFRGVNNAAGEAAGTTTTATTVSITPTLPGSTAVGDRVFVVQMHSGASSGATPAGWTVLGTKDTVVGSGTVAAAGGLRRMTVFWRDRTSAWSMPAFTVTSAAQNSHWVGALSITPTSGSYFNTPTISTVGGAFNAATTSYTDTSAASFATTSGGFLIAATCLNDNVTASAGAITQSGATLGAVTERADGGTATGNDVAGKIFTCSVTTGATATITHTETISAASQGETLFVQQTESVIPAKAETFTDGFSTADLAKWNFDAAATVSGGQLRITRSSSGFTGVDADNKYDLSGSYALVQVPQVLNVGNGTTQVRFIAEVDANNYLMLSFQGPAPGYIFADYWVNGVQTNIGGVAYSSSTHAWWRISESSGTLNLETSDDGLAPWDVQGSVALPWFVYGVEFYLLAGYYGTEPSPGTAILDNFNIPPSSGTNYTPSATDLVGATDSWVDEVGKNLTDLVGVTDALAKDFGRIATDLVGVTDSATFGLAYTASATDLVGVTDAISQTQDYVRPATDLVGITDSASKDAGRTATDLVGITDSASFSLTYFAAATDLVGITDSASKDFGRNPTDLVGVTDAASVQQDWVRPQTDLVGLTDSLSKDVSKVYTDPVGVTDSSVLDQGRLATDPLGITDSLVKDVGDTSTDLVGVTDSATWARATTLTDLVGLTDSFAKVSAYIQSATDLVGITDSATFVPTAAGNINGIDLVGITDSLAAQQSRFVTFTDLVGVTDSLTKDVGDTSTDSVGVTDSLSTASGVVKSVTDSVAINDALVWASSRDKTDTVGLSDSATFELSYIQALTDPVGVADSATFVLVGDQVRVFSDDVGVSDLATFTLGEATLTLADLVGITDSARFYTFLPPGPDNSWVPKAESVQHIPGRESVRFAGPTEYNSEAANVESATYIVKTESTRSEVAR